MSRSTRSRATALMQKEANFIRSSKRTANKKITKDGNVKAKLKAKKISDENKIPRVICNKLPNTKNLRSSILETASKILCSKNNNPSKNDSTALTMKSPVLRDRTNESNKLTNIDMPLNKISVLPGKNSRSNSKELVNNANKKNNHSNAIKVSNKQNNPKILASGNPKTKKLSLQEIEELTLNSNQLDNVQPLKLNPRKIDKMENNGVQQNISHEKLVSPNNTLEIKTRVIKRKNISIEAVEKLLNEDENLNVSEGNSEDKNKNSSNLEIVKKDDVLTIPINNNRHLEERKVQENSTGIKKFFKTKGTENIKITDVNTNNLKRKNSNSKKVINNKRMKGNDSVFSVKVNKNKPAKVPEKVLRRRAAVNYCEISRLSQSIHSRKDNVLNRDKIENEDKKGVPIYKTIRQSQENTKENIKEKVYDFPDDSQENIQIGKKRKMAVKKIPAKRAKKVPESRPVIFAKKQKIAIKKVQRKVQFEEKCKELIHTKQDVPTKMGIPEIPADFGNNSIAEASTIIINSSKKLEASSRISLTATPPVPKTITSELKLFGPKNAITSEPTTTYSNMVNHSLIRKSMSPISKLVTDFDTGSPWRAIETFSRVNKMVQSTPQIHKLPSMREKKLPVNRLNVQKKSFCSEDTIHATSYINPKSLNNSEIISPTKKDEVSPRKFGTVISNLNPEPLTNKNVNSMSPVKQNEQSSVKTVSSSRILSGISVDLEDLSTVLAENKSSENKENTIPSPKKSPKKKITVPSPFRFEKLRSIKKTTSTESNSKSSKSISQSETEDPEPKPGPSRIEKPVILRQTNLNNFLNLDEMPESSRISTEHGIFDDVHSTPINGKKRKNLMEEQNIENAFGFDDDCDTEVAPAIVTKSTSIIATETDVKKSVKGKIFPKARVKSAVTSRISRNTIKEVLLKSCLQKKKSEDAEVKEVKKNAAKNEISEIIDDTQNNNNNKTESIKSSILDAVSFSDTFDMLSENGEEVKVPNEIPLFVDLEPLHFNQPPRRSYYKRKRAVCFDTSECVFDDEDDDDPKPKKKKESKQSKQERKRLQEWVKNVNETFEAIDQFDLVVE